MNYITNFEVRNDAHFRWDEFLVIVEFCDVNIQKVALYAVEGRVSNNAGDVWEATEQKSSKVEIPFDRLGDLLHHFQRHIARKVVNVITGKSNFIYIISTEREGRE